MTDFTGEIRLVGIQKYRSGFWGRGDDQRVADNSLEANVVNLGQTGAEKGREKGIGVFLRLIEEKMRSLLLTEKTYRVWINGFYLGEGFVWPIFKIPVGIFHPGID